MSCHPCVVFYLSGSFLIVGRSFLQRRFFIGIRYLLGKFCQKFCCKGREYGMDFIAVYGIIVVNKCVMLTNEMKFNSFLLSDRFDGSICEHLISQLVCNLCH